MATACRLAIDNNVPVVGVSAIMIPVREPLDAPRPEREADDRTACRRWRARWRPTTASSTAAWSSARAARAARSWTRWSRTTLR